MLFRVPPLAPLASFLKGIVVLVLVGIGRLCAQQCDAPGITFSGPIVIMTGGTYTGNWESSDPSVPAVTIHTGQAVTIVGSRLKGPGNLIEANGWADPTVTLAVRQSCFVGTNPNMKGAYKGYAITVYMAASVLVENCDFEWTANGLHVNGYGGDHTENNTIKALYNRFHNLDGRPSDGQGGWLATPNGGGESTVHQLVNVRDVPGIEIAWNQVLNDPNQSSSGGINLYGSSGTAASPIQIHDNFHRGSYPYPANAGESSKFLAAVIVTDGPPNTDPKLATAFAKIHDNQAVSVSFSAFDIALGHDNEMYSNRVVSNGQLSDGTNISTSFGSGINHVDWQNDPPGVFGSNSVHNNVSGMRVMLRNGKWSRSDYNFSLPPAISYNNAPWSPATSDAPTLIDEANELLLWNEKLIANGIRIGSNLVTPALNGSVQVVSGNNQVGAPKATLTAPLMARVVDQSGSPVAGVSVSFMVTTGNATASQRFAVTDTNGLASSSIVLGTAPPAVHGNVIAAGYTGASFSLWITQPAASIAAGGISGVGGSVPPVQSLSQNGLISIYGQGFLPDGVAGRRVLLGEFVNGGLPFALQGVCVDVGGQRAAMLDVYPGQINAQVPAVTGGNASVRVLTNCGTPFETASASRTLTVSAASPEFLYFQLNPDGKNPVVLVNAITGALVGPSTILNGVLTPAHAGDVLTAYGTGFGPLMPTVATGQIPAVTASVTLPVSVSIGGVPLAATDVLYAGAAPGQIIDQLNFRVPANVAPGNQAIVISIGGLNSPANAFVAIQQ